MLTLHIIMSLITLEPQNSFPVGDVSDKNADMLELVLLNLNMVELSHASAENMSYLYKMGHQALVLAAAPFIDNDDRKQAFSYGITVFEAIAALVKPIPDIHGSSYEINLKVLKASMQLDRRFVTNASEARDVFSAELPRTVLLVGRSASRFCQTYSDYAVTGAAMARQLEVEAAA